MSDCKHTAGPPKIRHSQQIQAVSGQAINAVRHSDAVAGKTDPIKLIQFGPHKLAAG